MRNLHPELIASVQARTLYSKAEEDLLGTIKSVIKFRFTLLEIVLVFFFFSTIFTSNYVTYYTRWLLFDARYEK